MSIHRARILTTEDHATVGRWARALTALHFAALAIMIVVAASVSQPKASQPAEPQAQSYQETGAPPATVTVG